jgi:hypothetical protein
MIPTLALETDDRAHRPLLRPASFDDYDQMAAVEAANGLSIKPREEWLHLWQSNPAYLERPDCPIGWVLEAPNGRIVGCVGNVPSFYRLGGRTYMGTFARGWAVDTKYRAFSLLLLARQLQQRDVDLHVTSTASPKTTALLSQRGWSRVPAGEWDRSAFWVTSYAQALPRYLAAKMPRPFSSLAATLLYPPLLLKDVLSGRGRGGQSPCELRWCAGFDERFDEFWTELENRNPDVLLSVRSRRTLAWHFKYALEQNRIWILTACDGPRLVAYAILERRHSQAFDVSRMLLVDFQALAKDRTLASAMVSCILERCRREGVAVLENAGCWLEKKQPLTNRAPYRRDLGNWCYVYHTRNPNLSGVLQNAESWDPTQYDADASL